MFVYFIIGFISAFCVPPLFLMVISFYYPNTPNRKNEKENFDDYDKIINFFKTIGYSLKRMEYTSQGIKIELNFS